MIPRDLLKLVQEIMFGEGDGGSSGEGFLPLKMGAASKCEPLVSGPCQNFDLQQGRRKFK